MTEKIKCVFCGNPTAEIKQSFGFKVITCNMCGSVVSFTGNRENDTEYVKEMYNKARSDNNG